MLLLECCIIAAVVIFSCVQIFFSFLQLTDGWNLEHTKKDFTRPNAAKIKLWHQLQFLNFVIVT